MLTKSKATREWQVNNLPYMTSSNSDHVNSSSDVDPPRRQSVKGNSSTSGHPRFYLSSETSSEDEVSGAVKGTFEPESDEYSSEDFNLSISSQVSAIVARLWIFYL